MFQRRTALRETRRNAARNRWHCSRSSLCQAPLRGRGVLFFFFQAEDGIRDVAVTGVQTCALPICSAAPTTTTSSRKRSRELVVVVGAAERRRVREDDPQESGIVQVSSPFGSNAN